MSAYTVTFDRIGRVHDVAPLDVADTGGDELAHQIWRYARRFLGSKDVEVEVYGSVEVDGDIPTHGVIVVGGVRPAGTFTPAGHVMSVVRHDPLYDMSDPQRRLNQKTGSASTHGQVAAAAKCPDPRCGTTLHGGIGIPPHGWIRVQPKGTADGEAPIFCSWHCAGRHCVAMELRGGGALTFGDRPDVSVSKDRSAAARGRLGILTRWHNAGKHDDQPHQGCPQCATQPLEAIA